MQSNFVVFQIKLMVQWYSFCKWEANDVYFKEIYKDLFDNICKA